jgi:AraC-like DNA-binding protein
MSLGHLPELLERMNVRFENLLRQVGLPDVPLDREDSFLPRREVLAVDEAAARATGVEHFGLLSAQVGGLDALGRYGRHIKGAPTLNEAIGRANRFNSWLAGGATLRLVPERSNTLWCYALSPAICTGRYQSNLFYLALMHDVVRLAAGKTWFPDEVRLRSDPVGQQHELREAFGDRIIWGADVNALVFPRTLLAHPLLWTTDRWPAPDDAAVALEATIPAAEFVGSLRLLIRSFLSAGCPSAALLARVSGLSLRSFQRHLTLAGVNFSDLVAQVRCEVAFDLMRDPGVRLIEIGLELGYSDSANFTRAFRRWTGFAPHLYRQSVG